ncbi:MAG: NAD-dependent deacetylase [Actinomycetota bacterium]
MDDIDRGISEAAELLRAATRVVMFTGAGISTDSGIPDFRGPDGLWTKNPLAEKTSTLSWYLNDPEVRKAAWANRARTYGRPLQPNGGHHAVTAIHATGKLSVVVTQNVDGLHQDAGIPEDMVVEVHGTVKFARCWECKDRRPMGEYIEKVLAGDPDPKCVLCGGIVKSDAILFEQTLEPAVINRAFEEAAACDLLFAVGSTLKVIPANEVVTQARAGGAKVIIVNGDPTAMDSEAHLVIRGRITPTLTAIVAAAR